MKTLFSSPFFLLLSSVTMNNAFYKPAALSQLNRFFSAKHQQPVKFTGNILESKRRKSEEELPLDFDDEYSASSSTSASTSKKRKNIKPFQPKTQNQIDFMNLMRDNEVDIVIVIGPAGTGKTMLACYAAVEALRLGKVKKIVITRPVVSVDEEIGFLPGGLESKMDPWTRPIFDSLRETYSAVEIEKMMTEGIIEIVPLGFMRGRTFKNAWIIADEMQNSSPTQMFMLATRIGEGSKMIITGDLHQSDLNTNTNGLLEINKKLRHSEKHGQLNYIRYIELDKEDVQRSRAAKAMLDIWEADSMLPEIVLSEATAVENDEFDLSYIYTDYNEETRYSNEFAGEVSLTQNGEEDGKVEKEEDKDYFVVSPSPKRKIFFAENLSLNSTPAAQFYIKTSSSDAALMPLEHVRQIRQYRTYYDSSGIEEL